MLEWSHEWIISDASWRGRFGHNVTIPAGFRRSGEVVWNSPVVAWLRTGAGRWDEVQTMGGVGSGC
ncbi:hypothetical protein ATK36_3823 [Amycolatopsis sulphurea]|uniref:Uncharacterized protein n=1 Tax=Amycolatopsis sulphurea TaxID=76022 RepID=A0A2A9FBB6_9PSEU|nr:hypothetical protein ATK36_3823 [Amycolatopsis sulphurea]